MGTSGTDRGCAACGAAEPRCCCAHPGLHLLCPCPGQDTGSLHGLLIVSRYFIVASWCQYKTHWNLLVSLNSVLRGAQVCVPPRCQQSGLRQTFHPSGTVFLHRVRTVKGWGGWLLLGHLSVGNALEHPSGPGRCKPACPCRMAADVMG